MMSYTAAFLALAMFANSIPTEQPFVYEPYREILAGHSEAAAPSEETEFRKKAWEHVLFGTAAGFYAFASWADLRTTLVCLPYSNCSEANPVGAWIYEEWEDAGMLAVKLVLTGAVITTMTWLWLTQADSKWEKILIIGAMSAIAGVQGYVVDRNIVVLFSVSVGG